MIYCHQTGYEWLNIKKYQANSQPSHRAYAVAASRGMLALSWQQPRRQEHRPRGAVILAQ